MAANFQEGRELSYVQEALGITISSAQKLRIKKIGSIHSTQNQNRSHTVVRKNTSESTPGHPRRRYFGRKLRVANNTCTKLHAQKLNDAHHAPSSSGARSSGGRKQRDRRRRPRARWRQSWMSESRVREGFERYHSVGSHFTSSYGPISIPVPFQFQSAHSNRCSAGQGDASPPPGQARRLPASVFCVPRSQITDPNASVRSVSLAGPHRLSPVSPPGTTSAYTCPSRSFCC